VTASIARLEFGLKVCYIFYKHNWWRICATYIYRAHQKVRP